ncbi:receptor-type tyrosine-protein phosphatase mu-like [Watersipora subatra]|uniref:receptor-type tyrosine-protein phosphatase mu-like n=1 Tax=Watersipora subatra TaxID=2589382 RepID=UPI00355AF688
MDTFENGMRKAKILDYYTMMPETSYVLGLSPAAKQRVPIRGACNICQKPIRGSHRVKSNFICHLKRCHPAAYEEFEVRSGRKSGLLSISPLDEPMAMGMVANHMIDSNSLQLPHTSSNHVTNSLPMPPPAHIGSISASASSNAAFTAAAYAASSIKQENIPNNSVSPGVFPVDIPISPSVCSSVVMPSYSIPNATIMEPPSEKLIPRGETRQAKRQMSNRDVQSDFSAIRAEAQKQRVSNALLDFIIGNKVSPDVIDTQSFRNLALALKSAKDSLIPSSEEVKDIIQNRSDERFHRVKEQLEHISSYCLSEESYVSKTSSQSYATVSVHYMQEWSYKHMTVLCKDISKLHDKHSAILRFREEHSDVYPAAMQCIVCNLSQQQALPGFVDMTPVSVPALHNYSEGYSNSFTNEIGNAVICALQEDAQSRVVQLINHASSLLTRKAEAWDCPLSEAVHWYQQLKLLEVVLNRSEQARDGFNSDESLLDAAEMIELKNVLQMLKPFQDVIEQFHAAAAQSCSSSLVVPYHRLLLQNLSEMEAKYPDSPLLGSLHRAFLERTDFVEMQNTHATVYTTATMLDPRFKLRWCEDKDYDMYKEHLVAIAKNIMKVKMETDVASKTNGSVSSVFAKILKKPLESSEDAAVATDVMRYLREPIIPEDSDILGYWKHNELNFPSLSILARRYLAIPTSSVDLKDVSTNFAPPDSMQLSGNLLERIVELSTTLSDGDILRETLTERRFTISELIPYSQYVFSVALQLRGVPLSPASNITASTLESVPTAVGEPVQVVQMSDGMNISWSRPARNTAELLYWQLGYTVNGTFHIKNVSADDTSYILPLSDVKAYSNYTNITVLYTKLAGPGGSPVIDDRVKENATTQLTIQLCGLDSGSQYHITVSAMNQVGKGTGVSITGWTRIGSPPAPNVPELLSQTDTTITLKLFPVTSDLGPVTYYEIWVAELPTSARRKRDLDYQSLAKMYARLSPVDFGRGYYDFVVGDNRTTYGSYLNSPLKESREYDIYHAVVSVQDDQTESNSTVIRASTANVNGGLSTGWVVAIACIILVVLALIVIISMLIWCRFKATDKSSGYTSELITKHGYSPQLTSFSPIKDEAHSVYTGFWSPAYELGEDRHIVLEEVEEEVYTDKPSVTFQQEFNSLPRGQQYPWTEGAKHPELNRVSHLVAYDHNRVKLTESPLGVDYINATHITGYANKSSYIATTSPFNEECALQFWQMIYDQKVSQIVMMTNMIDEGIVKCVQYWPEHVGDREVFGNISVELISAQTFANFTIYRMKLSHQMLIAQARDIVQYHYTGWPAHGVPHTTFPILDFRLAIRSVEKTSPLVVHCGTGSSTTGFFIALDYLIAEADANGNNVNVFRVVSHLRESRSFLVRTQKQYLYIYDCLFEYLLGGDKILSRGIKSKFRLLSKASYKSGQRYFAEEMKRLNKFTPNQTKDDLTAALLEPNRFKNRYSDDVNILPTDLYRVKLSLEHGTSDYINAVYLDGYHQSNAFIITQTPLNETVVDFWRMVYEQGVSTIVMMDGIDLQEDTCAEYWPDLQQLGLADSNQVYKSYGEFDVQLCCTQQITDVCATREMIVTNRLQPSEPSRHVKQFQVLDWFLLNRPKPPKSGRHMLRLMEEVDEWKRSVIATHNQSCSSPVVVHCLNGATHSAVFPAVSFICEKMDAEGHVNIFLTVKEIKHRKKDALVSKHQYKYLHTVLRDYLSRDMPGPGGDHYQQHHAHRRRDESSYNNDSYESYNDDDYSDEQSKLEQLNGGDFQYKSY